MILYLYIIFREVGDGMEENNFKTKITSKKRVFDLHLKETFSYKDLIFLFVKRDFTAKYKQTVLGPVWAVIQPILTTIVFTVIFGNLAGLTISDAKGSFIVPSFLFYMSGSIIWNYFSSTLNATSTTFISNSHIMSKVYYPRLVTPIATAFSNLITFAIQFCLFLGLWLFCFFKGGTDIKPSFMLLMLPVTLIEMMILSVGFGIIISSVTTKYRDLIMLVGFGLQLWQYASPVAYGLGLIPEKYLTVYMLNPVTPIITTFRYSVFGFGYFNIGYFAYSLIFSLVVFVIGLIIFSRIERSFTDTI